MCTLRKRMLSQVRGKESDEKRTENVHSLTGKAFNWGLKRRQLPHCCSLLKPPSALNLAPPFHLSGLREGDEVLKFLFNAVAVSLYSSFT